MYSHFARFCFVIFALLLAICLVAVSPHAQSDSGVGVFGGGDGSVLSDVQFSLGAAAVNMRSGIAAAARAVVGVITYVPRQVVNLFARITDIRGFVKPADALQLPVIVPLKNTATIVAAPIATASPNTSPPATQSAAVVTAAAPVAISGVNRYARGNCTWWVFQRRAQAGDPIPNNWGNAAAWASRAAREGYVVNRTPSPGAIMQTANSAGGLGHVAFVESVDADGSWHISEMNVVGLGIVSHRTMSPSSAASYNFIHDH